MNEPLQVEPPRTDEEYQKRLDEAEPQRAHIPWWKRPWWKSEPMLIFYAIVIGFIAGIGIWALGLWFMIKVL